MSQLKDFAQMTQARAYVEPSLIEEALTRLTSHEAMKAFARTLLLDARTLFRITDSQLEDLAEKFARPDTRRHAEWELQQMPFADPATQWAGTGYSLVMDAVYGEDEPLSECHIVVLPAEWGSDVWSGDRDLVDGGYEYRHWVHAHLPTETLTDHFEPLKLVLMSDNLCGSLCWGPYRVSLYHGEVTVRRDRFGSSIIDELDAAAMVH